MCLYDCSLNCSFYNISFQGKFLLFRVGKQSCNSIGGIVSYKSKCFLQKPPNQKCREYQSSSLKDPPPHLWACEHTVFKL